MTRLERLERAVANWPALPLSIDDVEWALAMLREAEQKWECSSTGPMTCLEVLAARLAPAEGMCARCSFVAKFREEAP